MDEFATPRDAMQEYAISVGGQRPDNAWILTDYDVWVTNPHYRGPSQPHPEDYVDEARELNMGEQVWCQHGCCLPPQIEDDPDFIPF